MEIERAHDSLLDKRLEKECEWFEELERRGALLEQREEKTNREETQRSKDTPTHSRRGRTVSLPEGLGTDHAIRVRAAHENRNLLDGRQGTRGT